MESDRENSLASYSGRHTKVAIVASGIDARHPKLAKVGGGIELAINKAGRIISGLGTALVDRVGHGTACAGIVHRIAPAAEIFSVRICDEALAVDERLVLAALRWAIEQRVDIISLSLGIADSKQKDELAQVCSEAVAQRIMLVVTAHSKELPNYLGSLSDTIGVAGGRVRGYGAYYYRADAEMECIARGDIQRVCWLERSEISRQDSRFAVPHIVGVLALLREKVPQANLAQIRALLAAHALNSPSNRAVRATTSRAKKGPSAETRRVVLYPYSKEMQALVRFKDLLPFEIAGVAGPLVKEWVGCDAGEVIGGQRVDLPIAARWPCAGAGDTLVLGRVENAGRNSGRDRLRECVEQALERDLHVFSFFPLAEARYADLHALARSKGCRLVYPWIDGRQALAQIRAPVAGESDVPVLGIWSTNYSRENFSLQLGLRRQFLRRGYRLRQLGTEPPSRLFGMDFCFPIGSSAGLCLPLQYYPPFIAQLMRRLSGQSPDLVLVGSPAGALFGAGDKTHALALSSLAFLLGTRPDACILVVDSSDGDGHIEDALAMLRTMGKTEVLALAMSTGGKYRDTPVGGGKTATRRQSLEQRFLLPTVPVIGGEERLVELVEAHFFKEKKTRDKVAR